MGSITYDSNKNLLRVIGYKDEENKVPWSLEDIFNASESNGWNVVYRLPNGKGYKINAYFCIGDGSTETFLKILNEFLQLGDESKYYCMWLLSNATLQMGELDPKKGIDGINGGTLLLYQDYNSDIINVGAYNFWTGRLRVYGGRIVRFTTQAGFVSLAFAGEEDFRDSQFYSNQRWYFSPNSKGLVRKCYFHCADNYFYIYTKNISWEDIKLSATTRIIVSGKDTVIRNTNLSSISAYYANYGAIIKLFDCMLPSFTVLKGGDGGGKFYIYYSVKAKVVDINGNPIEGALVRIYDRFNNKVAEGTTNSDGYTEKFNVLVYYKYYSAPDTLEEEINYNPFRITVEKGGYPPFILVSDITEPMNVYAPLGEQKIMFGTLPYANVYEEEDEIILVTLVVLSDGTPVTDAVVKARVLKPDGEIVVDWSELSHLTQGIYIKNIGKLSKGNYIVQFHAEKNGLKTSATDSIQVLPKIAKQNTQEFMKKVLVNNMEIKNNQLIIYDDDGETPLVVFNLYDKLGNPTEMNVYKRARVQ